MVAFCPPTFSPLKRDRCGWFIPRDVLPIKVGFLQPFYRSRFLLFQLLDSPAGVSIVARFREFGPIFSLLFSLSFLSKVV